MIGMARMLNKHGWNALAWNYRGCSGEVNRQFRMYHNGSIDDLEVVIKHVGKKSTYQIIALIGFSLGGNLTLVYLGTRKDSLDPRIRKAVTFSVPCDLAEGARELVKRKNWFYMRQFLVSLHDKIKRKMAVLPGEIDDDGYAAIRNFKDFDDRYTAPITVSRMRKIIGRNAAEAHSYRRYGSRPSSSTPWTIPFSPKTAILPKKRNKAHRSLWRCPAPAAMSASFSSIMMAPIGRKHALWSLWSMTEGDLSHTLIVKQLEIAQWL
jgi:pimeloyl-ACP methyl ester carboxylesterase